MSKKQKITQKHNNNEIDLRQFISEFEKRAPDLRNQLSKNRTDHEKSVHDLIEHALQIANENIAYLEKNVSIFNILLTDITQESKSYFGKNIVEACREGLGSFLITRQFGYSNVGGSVAIGIYKGKFIITKSFVSHDMENVIYDQPIDPSEYKFLNCQQIMMELSNYRTPIKLLEMILLRAESLKTTATRVEEMYATSVHS